MYPTVGRPLLRHEDTKSISTKLCRQDENILSKTHRPAGCIPTNRQVQMGCKGVGRPVACELSFTDRIPQSADHSFAMWTPNALLQSSTCRFRTHSQCPVGRQDAFRPTDRCRWALKESADQLVVYWHVTIVAYSRPTILSPSGHQIHPYKALQENSGHTLDAQSADRMHSDRLDGTKGLQRSRPTRCWCTEPY